MFQSIAKPMVAFVLVGGLFSPHARSQNVVDEKSLVRKTLKVQVIDQDGNPIAAAKIKPFGLNTSYFWPKQLLGAPIESISDKEGIVSLVYPALFADSVQCRSIDCVVSHSEYVGSIARIPVGENETEQVTLKRGVRFRLNAIELDGTPAKDRFMAIMSGQTLPEFQQVGGDGLIETRNADTGPHQVMLVQPMKDSKTRFSEALFFHFNDRDQEKGVVVDDVELLPGVRVFGELPAEIKRPIKDGLVIAWQRPLPMSDEAQQGLQQLRWSDYTTIDANGFFEFSSMPRSGKIQIIALCDGWLSSGERTLTKGQIFDVAEEDLKVQLELQPTMDGVLVVKDERGNPIEDARVGSCPNQLWEGYGTQILGQRQKTIDLVKMQLDKTEAKSVTFEQAVDVYFSKTDKSGRATIRNLPGRVGNQFSVYKKGFKSVEDSFPEPTKPEGADGESSGRLQSKVFITLKKDDTE